VKFLSASVTCVNLQTPFFSLGFRINKRWIGWEIQF